MKNFILHIGLLILITTPVVSSAQEESIQSLWQRLLQLQRQMVELFAKQDGCTDLVGTSFKSSVADQVVGVGPYGIVLGKKIITFGDEGTVSWTEGDAIVLGTYTCSNNMLEVTSQGVVTTVRYHPHMQVLTWGNSNYEKVEN